jgi:hypothetical protein
MGHPTIFPTGVTIYDRNEAWNGYTLCAGGRGVSLLDMNGRELRRWEYAAARILPGGFVVGTAHGAVVKTAWDGKTVWQFDSDEELVAAVPAAVADAGAPSESMLILLNRKVDDSKVSGKSLLDSRIVEAAGDGSIVWEWNAHEHFEELGFGEDAKNVIYRLPSDDPAHGGGGLWLGINGISVLGPNEWFDRGDERFNPQNIAFSSRNANILGVISKKTGEIVWRLGPDFSGASFGQVIGPHDFHLIKKGLSGEGDFLVFDNGGLAGYGASNGVSKYGTARERRDYSRVIEFHPTVNKMVWQYTPTEAGHIQPLDAYKFYSPFFGAAQRLPNGNTLITEGDNGRLFEVTLEHKTVWEYVNPHFSKTDGLLENHLCRATRVPYDWVPQLAPPKEESVAAKNVCTFRVAGAGSAIGKVTRVAGVELNRDKLVDDPFTHVGKAGPELSNFCVVDSGE